MGGRGYGDGRSFLKNSCTSGGEWRWDVVLKCLDFLVFLNLVSAFWNRDLFCTLKSVGDRFAQFFLCFLVFLFFCFRNIANDVSVFACAVKSRQSCSLRKRVTACVLIGNEEKVLEVMYGVCVYVMKFIACMRSTARDSIIFIF